MTSRVRPGRLPFALVALVLVPGVAGALRLVELAGGPPLVPADPRATASPAPLVVHITCALAYAVVGAFQFSAAMRRRHLRWHRRAGRVLAGLALSVAASGLWMTLFYARQPGTGNLTWLLRLAAGSGLAASTVLGVTAVRRGDLAAHRAWMTRAYAVALGAGTQALTLGVGQPLLGRGTTVYGLLMGTGWVINLVVAERSLRRARPSPAGLPARPRPPVGEDQRGRPTVPPPATARTTTAALSTAPSAPRPSGSPMPYAAEELSGA